MGYATIGYRIWDLTKSKIVVSRDVVFDESPKSGLKPVKNGENFELCPDICVFNFSDPNWTNESSVEVGSEENAEPNLVEMCPETNMIRIPEGNLNSGDGDAGQNSGEEISNVISENNQDTNQPSLMTLRSGRVKGNSPHESCFTSLALNAGIFIEDIPDTVNELRNRDDWPKWDEAIKKELKSLEENQTWEIAELPEGRNTIDSKWVFVIKDEISGPRYKARLVAKGFRQRYGIDYKNTFAPVVRLSTVRILLAFANYRGLLIHQMDVETAFLHGNLEEDIFMKLPEGSGSEGRICRLRKSIYGLKQSPNCWNKRFNEAMEKLKFSRSLNDFCLYINKNLEMYLLLYVDDILIIGKSIENIIEFKKKLCQEFRMKDLGEAESFLGIQIERDIQHKIIKLSQQTYLEKVLVKFNMNDCNPVGVPMEPYLKLKPNQEKPTQKPFRELAGCLMYVALATRPDILQSVRFLCEYQANPGEEHWSYLKRILRYIKGTVEMKMFFRSTEDVLLAYSDADYANDTIDRKSISGFTIEVFGCTVSWSSKKQNCITLSSTEAEYVALCHTATEVIWITNILVEIGIKKEILYPVPIFEDNKSCIVLAEEPKTHNRMKHIDVRYHFVREKIAEGIVKLCYVPTDEQKADIFTKSLPKIKFIKFSKLLNIL